MRQILSYVRETLRLSLPFAFLGLGVLVYSALASQRQPPSSREIADRTPLVETTGIETAAVGLDLNVDGLVVPFREVQISAEVSGRITRKSEACQAGRFVTAGTVLVEIDQRTYALAAERLAEEVAQAENQLRELEVEISNYDALIALQREDLALKRRDLARVNQLLERGVVNEKEVDDNRALELTSRNSLVTLENQQRMAQASQKRLESGRDLARTRLAEAQLELEKSRIVAPIDGVIVSETVEEGNYVATGTSLLTIDDTSAVEIRTTLRMDELNWVWQDGQSPGTVERPSGETGQDYHLPQIPATVVYELAGQEFRWQGVLSRYEGIGLDERTRTVPVRLLVANPRSITALTDPARTAMRGPRALVRGMFVDVTLHTRPNVPFLVVPTAAVQPGNTVWVVREGLLHRVVLRQTKAQGDTLLVAAGSCDLSADDQVVTTPLLLALEGMPVKLASPENLTESAAATGIGQ